MSQTAPVPSTPSSPPAPRFALDPRDKILIDGIEYAPRSSDKDGHILRRVDHPDLTEAFTHEQFNELRGTRGFHYLPRHFTVGSAILRLNQPKGFLGDLSEKLRTNILHKKDVLDDFLRREYNGQTSRSDDAINAFVDDYVAKKSKALIAEGKPVVIGKMPKPTTLRRWLKIYENAEFNAMALRTYLHRSGNKSPRFLSPVRVLMEEFANKYASRDKPTRAQLYKDLCAAIDEKNTTLVAECKPLLKAPLRRAFNRVIARLDPFYVYAAREGEDAARKRFFIVRQGLDVTAPLERVEIDEWRIHLHTLLEDAGVWDKLTPEEKAKVERGRYWLVIALDTATRCILAARIVKGTASEATTAVMEMAIHDKSHIAEAAGCQTPWDMQGVFRSIWADNGGANIAEESRAVVIDLGSEIHNPPAKTPQLRGRNERFFRTIDQQLIARFSGRTFEDVKAKGDYESEKLAVLTLEELGTIVVRWIVDVYHNTPHDGLGGETPRDAWLRLTKTYPVEMPPDPDRNRHIFGLTFERVITTSGIRFMGLQYQSLELQRHMVGKVGQTVAIRVDPANLGFISVEIDGSFLSVPTYEEMEGVPLDDWIAAEAALRRKHAKMAKLKEHVVFAALRDIMQFSDYATKRAGIASPILGYDHYQRIENDRYRTFSFTRGPATKADILSLDDPSAPAPGSDRVGLLEDLTPRAVADEQPASGQPASHTASKPALPRRRKTIMED